jgi:hypothetical protein
MALPQIPKNKTEFNTTEFAHYAGVSDRRIRTLAMDGRLGKKKTKPDGSPMRGYVFTRKELVEFRKSNRVAGKPGQDRVAQGKQ